MDRLSPEYFDAVLAEPGLEPDYENDFKSIKPRGGLVSELVRAMRDKRRERILG